MEHPKFAELEGRIEALEKKAGIKKAACSTCGHPEHEAACTFTKGDMYCTCGEVVAAADAEDATEEQAESATQEPSSKETPKKPTAKKGTKK